MPTADQLTKLHTTTPYANGYFGYEVGLSGDGRTAVVGAPGENSGAGNAYVYRLVSGTWTFQAQLESAGGSDTHYGASVAINQDGTTIAVGGPAVATGGDPPVGVVDVWVIVDDVWTLEQRLETPDTEGYRTAFGSQVRLSSDGNTLLTSDAVNTHSSDPGGPVLGMAYVFLRESGVWSLQAELFPTDDTGDLIHAPDLAFATSIALSGDGNTAAITAREYASLDRIGVSLFPGQDHGGAFWIFERDGTSWSGGGEAQWGVTDPPGSDSRAPFGYAIAISRDGNTVVTGGTGHSFASPADPDTPATIYTREAGWEPVATIDADPADFFWSVALNEDGTWLLVGYGVATSGGSPGPGLDFGFAAVFHYDGGWGQVGDTLIPLDGTGENLSFGSYMALTDNGQGVLIGGPGDDEDDPAGGAAWVFGVSRLAISLDGALL